MNYKDYNDNELLFYISENNEDANEIIYKKYEPLITNTAKKFIKSCENAGLELNDFIQEGMLGLSNAIKEFDEDKDVTFFTFAKTCIERKMISLAISSKRQKHKILNESLSLEITDEEGNYSNLEYVLGDNKNNPENLIINMENQNELIKKASLVLTDFEMQVFELKINDFGYKEIAEVLDKEPKAIDNALQRIKLKLKKNLNN